MAMQTQANDSGWQQLNTGSGTPAGFGDYRTLIASTNFRARWIVISQIGSVGGVAKLATGPFTNPGGGAPGTTTGVVHVEELLMPGAGQGMTAAPMSFEVDIPSGSEIGFQVRGAGPFAENHMIITISDTSLGLDVTASDEGGPVTMLMPGDDVSDSPVAELIASLAINATWMVFSIQTRDLTSNNTNRLRVDLMIGAAGVETPLINDLGAAFFQTSNVRPQSRYHCMPVDIDAGTRISARATFTDTGLGATHTQDIHVGVTFFG